MRTASIERKTLETEVNVTICLDGSGKSMIRTGVGFLDHMLTLFASHSRFDMTVFCKGDTDVDDHHSVEDIGIALGMAVKKALGNKRGIRRYGDQILSMDEALILSSIDFSGRPFLNCDLKIPTEKVGTFDTELVEEFWLGFVRNAECALHLRTLSGKNSHHIIEGAFKSAARSIRQAVSVDERFSGEIPSTKGVL
ncbi:MAG: imidazoleglycerol-phosphate dehydratase HisB [Lachnospiraceae bacterium]|nr:imidazoleglycerol-phosphate dehydratase HisB [Lachnospiraceae bacterium]